MSTLRVVRVRHADLYVSLMSREKTTLLTRYGGARKTDLPDSWPARVPHGGGSYSSQNRTSISCLPSFRTITEDGVWVHCQSRNNSREASRDRLSFAQAANGGGRGDRRPGG